ncbi:MAG TPA: alpha/beta hydrolase [Geminicoccus sp.]|uniref:alpha/beta fold hydrolase n=1 Tax=Geminicoccus sp. TaxID=2024832 RepID=UPI002E339B56|nr:alpha/beta hydrolase [Geminicoccus sp.]HEX2527781.1 alpha/beta hydrolase [Geminicoccus sp.]
MQPIHWNRRRLRDPLTGTGGRPMLRFMRSERCTLQTPDDGTIELHWLEHSDHAAGQVIVCVHGLTRNAHDFDRIATELALRGARVLAVDVPGRGGSSWLSNPAHYVVPVYADCLRTWLGMLGLSSVDWLGTSMGGLIGMEIAGSVDGPIRRLVLNDIGAFVPKEALAPIGAYLGLDLRFPDLEAVERHLRTIHAGFGRHLDDGWWRDLARWSARKVGHDWRMHYDPAIKLPFTQTEAADIDLWPRYDAIACPTLLLRGAESALLPTSVAQEMTHRGPRAELVTLLDCGHAPSLGERDQIEVVADWLCGPAPNAV